MVQHSSHLLLIDITISITSMKSQVPVPDQAVTFDDLDVFERQTQGEIIWMDLVHVITPFDQQQTNSAW